jgi:hypothetical protein
LPYLFCHRKCLRFVNHRTFSPAIARPQASWLATHWFLAFGLIYGLWVWLPFLAPVFMHIGWDAAGKSTINRFVLRQFIGSQSMGWRVAWSDRMVSFHGSIWLFALAWWAWG